MILINSAIRLYPDFIRHYVHDTIGVFSLADIVDSDWAFKKETIKLL